MSFDPFLFAFHMYVSMGVCVRCRSQSILIAIWYIYRKSLPKTDIYTCKSHLMWAQTGVCMFMDQAILGEKPMLNVAVDTQHDPISLIQSRKIQCSNTATDQYTFILRYVFRSFFLLLLLFSFISISVSFLFLLTASQNTRHAICHKLYTFGFYPASNYL